ncbi:MAG TPA: TolC family protein [Terriglobales bacterium]|nr:TolC family protein [Terriglobales bacterium]
MLRNLLLCILLGSVIPAWPQTDAAVSSGQSPQTSQTAAPLTLADAIRLARANAPQFRTAVTEAGIARENRVQARAALLPGVSYNTGAIYTEPNGTDTGVFIEANAVREYVSRGVVHESIGFSNIADYRNARFLEAAARAKQEVAARGLVAAVVKAFYSEIVASRKTQNAQAASDEANRFLDLSQKLERGGEVAHADVIKAQLQANDRQRDLQEARLAEEKARLDFAVLVFAKYTPDYQLIDDLLQTPALPDFAHAQDLASHNNPELKAAVAAMSAAHQEVASAIGGHLPTLSVNYLYGIDATHYATQAGAINNLGYQLFASLDLPIFNWGATQSKVKQAQLRRDQVQVELNAAQRQALADLHEFYSEAQTSLAQLDILRQSSDLAAESLRLTTLRYQGGEATALEVVDAQNTLVQSRNSYEDGMVRYRVALATLQTLTGTF